MKKINIKISEKPILKVVKTADEIFGYNTYIILPEQENEVIKYFEKQIPPVLFDKTSIFIEDVYEIDNELFANFKITEAEETLKNFPIDKKYLKEISNKNLFIDSKNKREHIFKPLLDLKFIFNKDKKLKPSLKIRDFNECYSDSYVYIYDIGGEKIVSYNDLPIYKITKKEFQEIKKKLEKIKDFEG